MTLPSALSAAPNAKSYDPPQNPLEDALALIWQRTLGLEHPVSVTEHFLDLGGNSLGAISMFFEVERVLRRQLPLTTLLAAPSVRQLANVMSSEGWSPPRNCLVPIQPGGSQPPLFCVSGMYGHVLNFYPLARALGNDSPLYGMQLPELTGKAFTRNIKTLGRLFLEEIRQVQPGGPYHFLGYSFGGYVAYEMSQILAVEGHSVEFLGMLDTWGPGYPKPRSVLGKALYHLGQALHGPSKAAFIRERWTALRARKHKLPCEDKSPGLSDTHAIDVRRESLREVQDYPIQPYAGPLTLFRALEQPTWMQACQADDSMGWRQFARNTQIRPVPGSHATILSAPNAPALAATVRAL
jgi:aspartate racemase